MFKRELTNLEERLYDFLDLADSTLEYDVSQKSWEKLKEAMKRCKEDCKVKYGVINNGYSLHVELPFDVDKHMKQKKPNNILQDMKEDTAVLAEKDAEISRLKAAITNGDVNCACWLDRAQELESENERLHQRERRLKRALYKACANWAKSERYTEATWHGDEHREELWAEVQDKCLKKAEEY